MAAPVTSRVSYEPDGSQRTDPSFVASISADGSLVAYVVQRGLCTDQSGPSDVYLYDRTTGKTESISAGPFGTPGNGSSSGPSISADGRYVAFASSSDNLVPGDTNHRSDIFVRDRHTGGIERIPNNLPGRPDSFGPSISRTGRFVPSRRPVAAKRCCYTTARPARPR